MSEAILGMPGPWAEDKNEASDHYTTKIGGLPDWPIPNIVIRPDLLECSACGNNLCLVAQIYAPISNKTLTFEERLIYIFGCATPKCGKAPGSWRALRVQRSIEMNESNTHCHEVVPLPAPSLSPSNTDWRDNLWSLDSGEEQDDEDDDDDDINLEDLGRALSEAANLASDTKKQNNHRPVPSVNPSSISQTIRVLDTNNPVIPCFYIYTQEDAISRDVASVCSSYTSLSIKENRSEVDDHSKDETWDEEGYEYDRALNADRTYLKFKKRMDAYPEQCFRYLYGGKPLLATAEREDPRACNLCGGSRHYEMQLMPPLLYFLQEATNDHQKLSLENWDWMTVIVYTCSKSCSSSIDERTISEGWFVTEEFVVTRYE